MSTETPESALPERPFLSTAEVAAAVGVSGYVVRKAIDEGRLSPVYRAGHRYRIPRSSAVEYVEASAARV